MSDPFHDRGIQPEIRPPDLVALPSRAQQTATTPMTPSPHYGSRHYDPQHCDPQHSTARGAIRPGLRSPRGAVRGWLVPLLLIVVFAAGSFVLGGLWSQLEVLGADLVASDDDTSGVAASPTGSDPGGGAGRDGTRSGGATAPALRREEQATIDLFRAAAPGVVYITSLARRRDYFTLAVHEIPQGTGSGFLWDRERPGEAVELVIVRDGRRQTVDVRLGGSHR